MRSGSACLKVGEKLEAVHPFHPDVGNDYIRPESIDHTKGFLPAGRRSDLEPALGKIVLGDLSNRGLVVHHQDPPLHAFAPES